jgi:hypothetical protein
MSRLLITFLLLFALTTELVCGKKWFHDRRRSLPRNFGPSSRKVADESPCRDALLNCSSIGVRYQSCEVWSTDEYKLVLTRHNAVCHCKMHYGGLQCDQCAASTAALSSFPSCRSDEEVVDDIIASFFNVSSSHLFTTEHKFYDLSAQYIFTNSRSRNEEAIRFLLEALLGIRYPAAPFRAISSDNLIKLKNVLIDMQILATMHNNVSFVEVDALANSENPWELHNLVRLVIDLLNLG